MPNPFGGTIMPVFFALLAVIAVVLLITAL
jgi:hypothetical protein